MPITIDQCPVPGRPAIVERRFADQLDLHRAVQAADSADQHVIGVVVGRRAGVRRDHVVTLTWTHRQRVPHQDPTGRGLPRRGQDIRAGLVNPGGRMVDPERSKPEVAGLTVQQAAEHTGRVEPRNAQPADRPIGRDQGARVAVGQKRIIRDRRERRRRGRTLLFLFPLCCCAHDARLGPLPVTSEGLPPDPALSAVNHQLRMASSPLEGDLPPASGRTTTAHDTRRLAQSAVDQIEVGLPAVSLVVLPATLDFVAVLADGRDETLVERLALAPQFPLAVADAHLVDAADVPVVGVELVVAAVGRVAAVDTDAVGRLGRLHGGTLEQKLAALQPFEGALGLTRPRLAAGRRRRLAPLTDQHLEFLERLLRSRLIHGYPFPGLFPGLLIWTIHAIIADDQIAHMWGSQRTLLLMASLRRGDDAAPQLLDSLGSTLHGHATRLVGTLPVPYPAQHSRRRPADGYVDPLVACAVLNSEQPRPRADLPCCAESARPAGVYQVRH